MELTSITFVLENCEGITIDREHIGDFGCEEITSSITRCACNSISKHQYCKAFYIEINKAANLHYSSFGLESTATVFERLRAYNDITGIEITYEDGTSDYILMPWEDADSNGCTNKLQSSMVSDCEDLYIYIGETGSVTDLMDASSANDKEMVEAMWELYTACDGGW